MPPKRATKSFLKLLELFYAPENGNPGLVLLQKIINKGEQVLHCLVLADVAQKVVQSLGTLLWCLLCHLKIIVVQKVLI